MSITSKRDIPVAPADWPVALKQELDRNRLNGRIGSRLVSETERVRVWLIHLKPGERLPLHRHVLDYFWTATAAGKALSHNIDGRTSERSYAIGDTQHMSFAAGQSMIHDLENIGDTVLTFTTVEFKESANSPLPF
jgi:uncharacterized cupin superfamily protein